MKLLKKAMAITSAALIMALSFSCSANIDDDYTCESPVTTKSDTNESEEHKTETKSQGNSSTENTEKKDGDSGNKKSSENSDPEQKDEEPAKEYVDVPEPPIELNFPDVNFSLVTSKIKPNTKLELTVSDPDAVIHYTTDGSTPTAESPVYSEPIVLAESTTVRAVSEKEGYVGKPFSRIYEVYRQIGSKYSDEPKAVGDIVFKDGSAEPYSEDLVITAELKKQIVGVVFNTPESNSGIPKTLIMGVNKGESWNGPWLAKDELRSQKVKSLISDIQDSCPESGSYIEVKVGGKNKYVTGNLSGEGSYSSIFWYVAYNKPNLENSAFEAVRNNYGEDFHLPSLAEMELLSAQNKIVEKALSKAGDDADLSGFFWTCSQVHFENDEEDGGSAWAVRLDNGFAVYKGKSSLIKVCGVKEL